jgi:hypothetical protein
MTCKYCEKYEPDAVRIGGGFTAACALGRPEWPVGNGRGEDGVFCPEFSREPGSDDDRSE